MRDNAFAAVQQRESDREVRFPLSLEGDRNRGNEGGLDHLISRKSLISLGLAVLAWSLR